MADDNTWNAMAKKKKQESAWYEPEPGGAFDRFMNPTNYVEAKPLTPEQKKNMRKDIDDTFNGRK